MVLSDNITQMASHLFVENMPPGIASEQAACLGSFEANSRPDGTPAPWLGSHSARDRASRDSQDSASGNGKSGDDPGGLDRGPGQ